MTAELKEIRESWTEKYPQVVVTLWSHEDKYFGKMGAGGESVDLSASTVGELIGQGESFLRKVTS